MFLSSEKGANFWPINLHFNRVMLVKIGFKAGNLALLNQPSLMANLGCSYNDLVLDKDSTGYQHNAITQK